MIDHRSSIFYTTTSLCLISLLGATHAVKHELRWGNWSVCSRTCGSGVQFRKPSCIANRLPDVRCPVTEAQYRACHVQECQEGSVDFRSYQCQTFGLPVNVILAGLSRPWKSHIDPEHPCALVCEDESGNVVPLHQTLVDGTSCHLGDAAGICIAGLCQKDWRKSSKHVQKFSVSPVAEFRVLKKRNADEAYTWVFGKWTSCSRTCGSGYQMRAVACINKQTGAHATDPSLCVHSAPPKNQTCSVQPCQSSSEHEYSWISGHWGECNVDCGIGEQNQVVYCIKTDGRGNSGYTQDNLCLQHVGSKPLYTRACSGEGDNCPYWSTGSWGECSVSCGAGRQTRTLYCQRDPPDAAQSPEILDLSLCHLQDRPLQEQACYLGQCPQSSRPEPTQSQSQVGVVDCRFSRYGCCPDNQTPAQGFQNFGCTDHLVPKDLCGLPKATGVCNNYTLMYHFEADSSTCRLFWYGGCGGNANRFSSQEECEAQCKRKETVPDSTPAVASCTSSQFGCCPDQQTPARGPNFRGCYKRCEETKYGCCPDGAASSEGPNFQGCEEYSGDRPCEFTEFGCCVDGTTIAKGPKFQGCGEAPDSEDRVSTRPPTRTTTRARMPATAVVTEGKCTVMAAPSVCTEYVIKWRFNPQKSSCERHWWGGCADNGNMFDSEADCDRYCVKSSTKEGAITTEPPGQQNTNIEKCAAPASRERCSNFTIKWRFDQQAQRCQQHWWGGCADNGNVFESEGQCEAQCKNKLAPISPGGGEEDIVNICDMPREAGSCTDRLRRFYYEPRERNCRAFYYSGCQGNENNFETLEDCQRECTETTTSIETTTTTTSTTQEPTQNVPSSISISGDSAAVSGATVKIQCRAVGPGRPTEIEWFFNSQRVNATMTSLSVDTYVDPASRNALVSSLTVSRAETKNSGTYYCRSRPYGDYARLVLTVTERTATTEPEKVEQCLQPQDPGICLAAFPRFYFDSRTSSCQSFIYGGCQGNSNNFVTKEACETDCSKYLRAGTGAGIVVTDQQDVCRLSPERGSCQGYFIKWYYHAGRGQCIRFVYTGCQGNGNQFETEEECNQQCQPGGRDQVTPGVEKEQKILYVRLGSDVTLSCTLRSQNLLWYHEGFLLTASPRLQLLANGSLTLRAVTEDMLGTYACRVSGSSSQQQVDKFQLELNVPAKILPAPALVNARFDNPVYLHCQALGRPQPRVTWSRNGAPIRTSHHHHVFDNGTLMISKASMADAGDYICSAANGVNPIVSKMVRLHIKETISADIQRHQGSYLEGSTIQLQCSGTGYPLPQVQWVKDGAVLQSDSRISIQDGALTIVGATIEDAGLYKCLVSNQQGKAEDSTTVQIRVQDAPAKCEDTIERTRCHLIVTGRLCGFKIFAAKCCGSCRRAGFL